MRKGLDSWMAIFLTLSFMVFVTTTVSLKIWNALFEKWFCTNWRMNGKNYNFLKLRGKETCSLIQPIAWLFVLSLVHISKNSNDTIFFLKTFQNRIWFSSDLCNNETSGDLREMLAYFLTLHSSQTLQASDVLDHIHASNLSSCCKMHLNSQKSCCQE